MTPPTPPDPAFSTVGGVGSLTPPTPPLKGGGVARRGRRAPARTDHALGSRRGLTLEGLAAFEASKCSNRPPRTLRADVRREQVRVEASGKAHLVAETPGSSVIQ